MHLRFDKQKKTLVGHVMDIFVSSTSFTEALVLHILVDTILK